MGPLNFKNIDDNTCFSDTRMPRSNPNSSRTGYKHLPPMCALVPLPWKGNSSSFIGLELDAWPKEHRNENFSYILKVELCRHNTFQIEDIQLIELYKWVFAFWGTNPCTSNIYLGKRTLESKPKTIPVNTNLCVLLGMIVIHFHARSGLLTRGYEVWKEKNIQWRNI